MKRRSRNKLIAFIMALAMVVSVIMPSGSGFYLNAEGEYVATETDATPTDSDAINTDSEAVEIYSPEPEAEAPGEEITDEAGRQFEEGEVISASNGELALLETTVLPEDTVLEINSVSSEVAEAMVDENLVNEYDHIEWFDISLGDEHDVKAEISLYQEIPFVGSDVKAIDIIHIKDDGNVEVLEADAVVSEDSISNVSFQTESLSTFGVAYTVTYSIGEYSYTMLGDGYIYLSELIYELGLDIYISDVEEVVSSDESLLSVEFSEDDYIITSLSMFDTDETLTIYMNDGSYVVIDVVDPPATISDDLRDFVTDASIKAQTNDEGAYVVNSENKFTINLDFKEGSIKQFNDGTLMYVIPEGMNADGQSGQFNIKITKGGVTYTVYDNQYSIENGKLTINWNNADPNYNVLIASANAKFSLAFDAQINENATEIRFSDGIIKKVVVDNSNSVTSSKASSFDENNNKVNYTVTIKSSGNSKNVSFNDTITGNCLNLNNDSFTISSSVSGSLNNGIISVDSNSFSGTIPAMKNNEVITIKYSADVDPSVLSVNGGKAVSYADNSIKVKSAGDPDGDSTNVSTNITYNPSVSKSGAESAGKDENGIETLNWSITYNAEAKIPVGGASLTDTIDAASSSIMKYSGDGLTVNVYDSGNNLVRTDNVAWDSLASKSDSNWVYTIPSSDSENAYKYVISYSTEVDTSDVNTITNVKNKVETEGGRSSEGTGSVGPSGETVTFVKDCLGVDMNDMTTTWTLTFNVPAKGLDKAVITDTVPNMWGATEQYFEGIEGDIEVTGLIGDEHCDYNGQPNAPVLIFYKDNGTSHPGLSSGNSRTIVVTYKTRISSEWLEDAKKDSWKMDHTNAANLDIGTVVLPSSKTQKIAGPELKKSGAYVNNTSDGMPYYKYEIILNGVSSDSFEINDTFDTDFLELYEPTDQQEAYDSCYIFGGHQYYQGNKGSDKVGILSTAEGITFSVNSTSLPKDGEKYYTTYKLVYFLKVKNASALYNLKLEAINNGGTYELENIAEWNGQTGGSKIPYSYVGITKELLTDESDLTKTDEDIKLDFRITFNPEGQMLNNGEEMVLTDSVTNLSVDIRTIKATPNEGIDFDMTGDVISFTVPDSTPIVITYTAKVKYKELKMGDNYINFSNVAKMDDYKASISKTANIKNTQSASASVYSINIKKYESGAINKPLEGAVFELYELDEESNKVPVLDKNNKKVQFVSGKDGIAKIEGDMANDGWALFENKQYFLREIKAPKGFLLLDRDYSFIVSADGTTDYNNFIYHTDDTMSVKNTEGTQVPVSKIWSDGNSKHTNDSVTIKLLQRVVAEEGEAENTWESAKNSSGEDITLMLNNANNWSSIFTKLPVRNDDDKLLEYSIEEVEIDGYTSEITGNAEDGFVVTNTSDKKTGSLTVEKTVTGTNDYADKEYTVEITVAGTAGNSYTAVRSGSTAEEQVSFDSSNKAKVTLKKGESLKISGLPVDAEYSVVENPDSYNVDGGVISFDTVTYSSDVHKITEAGVKATVTNKFKAASYTGKFTLEGTKKLSDGSTPVPEFSFTLTEVADAEGTAISGREPKTVTAKNDTNGAFKFENVSVGALDFGTATTVTKYFKLTEDDLTEELAKKYSKDASGKIITVTFSKPSGSVNAEVTGTVSPEKSQIVFTNTINTGKITAKKNFVSVNGKTDTFYLTLFKVDGTDEEKYGTSATKSVEITGNSNGVEKTVEWTEVPYGSYKVYETDSSGAKLTASDKYTISSVDGLSVELEKLEKSAGTITNTEKVGKVEVTKVFDGITASEIPGGFEITNDYNDDKFTKANASSGAGTSASPYKWIIENVPVNTEITFIESGYDITNYTIKINDKEATSDNAKLKSEKVKENQSVQVKFINKYDKKTGSLTVEKTVISTEAADNQTAFNFKVTLSDTTINGTYGDMTFTNGVAEFTLKHGEAKIASGIPVGTEYTVEETRNALFAITKTGDTGTISEEKSVAAFVNTVKTARVKISKVDIANGEEVSGAHIQLLNSDGEVVDEWISSDEGPKEIEGLTIGETYTLRETVAPDGYMVTTDTTFVMLDDKTVDTDKTTTKVSEEGILLIEDDMTKVKISKVDITNEKELPGAAIQILEVDAEGNETVVREFVSSDKPSEITGLKTETTYILRETVAPEGYQITTDTRFELDKDGNIDTSKTTTTLNEDGVLLVEDWPLGSIVLSKYGYVNESCVEKSDEAAPLKDIQFTLTKTNDESFEPITASSDENGLVTFTGLSAGKYSIVETKTLDGYVLDEKTYTAEVNAKGEYLGLKDADGNAVDGNRLINDLERADLLIKKVNLDNEDETLPDSTYGLYVDRKTLLERYGTTIITDEGSDDELILLAESTTDKEGMLRFEGVLLDVEYTVKELESPDGFYVSENPVTMKFSKNRNGEIILNAVDDGDGTVYKDADGNITWLEPEVKVSFLKTDAEGNALAGAKLKVVDKDNKEIISWTSASEAKLVEGTFIAGEKYTLIESEAPEGYKLASPVSFSVDRKAGAKGADVISVVMVDEKEEKEEPTTEDTTEETTESTTETTTESTTEATTERTTEATTEKKPEATTEATTEKPETPEKTTEAQITTGNTDKQPAAPGTVTTVNTADRTPFVLMLVVIIAAFAGMVITIIIKRKNRYNK